MNITNKETLGQWLTLRLTPQLGVKTLQKLMDHQNITINELLSLDASKLSHLKLNPNQIKAITQPDKRLIDQLIAWTEPADQHILSYFDPQSAYPEYLKNIASPPMLLFVKGNAQLLNRPQLAMVGSQARWASL